MVTWGNICRYDNVLMLYAYKYFHTLSARRKLYLNNSNITATTWSLVSDTLLCLTDHGCKVKRLLKYGAVNTNIKIDSDHFPWGITKYKCLKRSITVIIVKP